MKLAAIIVAAGKGERAGGGVPKQFQMLAGRSVLAHAVERLRSVEAIQEIVVVIGEGQQAQAGDALNNLPMPHFVEGGKERQNSVRNGLEKAKALGATHVFIHDAARPFLPLSVSNRLIAALESHAGAVPVLPVVDTLAQGDNTLGGTVDRSSLYHVQTPQAFALDAILDAHDKWDQTNASDDAQMARAAGYDVAMIEGDLILAKLTHAADFARMEKLLAPTMISKIGMGYDVHRLGEGEELWLCGIRIPHSKGLIGHSDADVALHALVDAILGAIADGDIGTHFPPSDPQWRGAPSSRFIKYARDRVIARGGQIAHVDLTIICEAPKIGPHRDAMRAELARLLQLDVDTISIKATTTERLGFTGREEGIAAQAVATILMPMKAATHA